MVYNFVLKEFYVPRPSLLECYFFPNIDNEIKVANMIRNCKSTLDIAIFTLTNDKIFAAIEDVFKRGIPVRIIADDECCKMLGSDVIRAASIGIPVKTDCAKSHMHHKFAIIDNSVVVTGSFNWTVQAVKMNQENILFYENPTLAQKYTEEYNRVWNTFTTVITKEESLKILKEAEQAKLLAKKEREKQKELAKTQKK